MLCTYNSLKAYAQQEFFFVFLCEYGCCRWTFRSKKPYSSSQPAEEVLLPGCGCDCATWEDEEDLAHTDEVRLYEAGLAEEEAEGGEADTDEDDDNVPWKRTAATPAVELSVLYAVHDIPSCLMGVCCSFVVQCR